MTSNVVWGIDFRAKRRVHEEQLESMAISILCQIDCYGFDAPASCIDGGLVPVDTAPSEYWPLPDGAA